MSIAALDKNCAPIIIDLQNGIVGRSTAQSVDGVIKQASARAEAFQQHALPVVLVNLTGGAPGRTAPSRRRGEMPADWAKLIPQLNQPPGDHQVTKRTWAGSTDTGLDARLKTLGVTQMVIVEAAADAGVESTARYASECSYSVPLAVDAMTDMRLEAHDIRIRRIFPRLGATATAPEIIAQLGQVA